MGSKLDALVKITNEHIVQFIAGNYQSETHDHQADSWHEYLVVVNDPIGEMGHQFAHISPTLLRFGG